MSARHLRPRATAGFSLISVMFAVALLVFGLLVLARSQTLLSRTSGTSGLRNRAFGVAQAHMELLRSQPPASLATQTGVAIDSLGREVAGGIFTRNVLVDQQTSNLLRVRVQVAFPQGLAPVEISTLIFR